MFCAGRVARAGRTGVAYSLVSVDEVPYLLDLHLFLGRGLQLAGGGEGKKGVVTYLLCWARSVIDCTFLPRHTSSLYTPSYSPF